MLKEKNTPNEKVKFYLHFLTKSLDAKQKWNG